MTRLLVVDDEPSVAAAIGALLQAEGYEVVIAASVATARRALSPEVALVILDWMLGDGSGIDLLREWRKTSDVPVIFVTARTDVVDRVVALELGADDYVMKPMDGRELVARVRARLRPRGVVEAPRRLRHRDLSLDLELREARRGDEVLSLTRMEFGLLALLVEHPGRVFSREELLNRVWGYERTPTTRTVDTHVLQLRGKIGEDAIESVRGIGYRLRKESP